ncbi:hypothetical protein RhiJN_03398 [Ceratobasidium sp. AG-Ba]|nr:hypothetical protein RhiJN_03398 [Ceratobasidium sp. AG-Ba]QRW04290.1 hypothetical protein RhiLY_03289 [Ceratobasidium sp. AG-Ba]
MTSGEMAFQQKPSAPSPPLTSSKVFDLASPNLDPLERLRQLDSFGQKDIRRIHRRQELLLAVASALVPPIDSDVKMMNLFSMLVAPQGYDQQGHPTTVNPLQFSNIQESSTSVPNLQQMPTPSQTWSDSNPSDDPHSVSSNAGVLFDLGAVPPALQILIDRTLVGDLRKYLSTTEIRALASDTRKSPNWTNFERNLIILALFGATRILSDESTIHIDTPFSIRKQADAPGDWTIVQTQVFGTRRSSFSIAQQYARMLKIYCHLAIMFADHEQQLPVPVFLQRVYGGMSASTDGSIVGIPAKGEDLLLFIEGGDASWLATFYCALHGDPRLKARYTSLCNKTIKANAGSAMSSSGRSTRPLPQRSNLALSTVHQDPNNQNDSLELSSTTGTDNDGPSVGQNMNAVADLLRDNQVITEANIQEAKSRASYLLRVANQMRWDLIAAIHAQRKQEIKDKYDKCIAALENPNLDVDIKADAKKFVRAYFNDELGQPDITTLIWELRADLPSLDKLTNIFYHAPALDPKNAAAVLAAAATTNPVATFADSPAAFDPATNV